MENPGEQSSGDNLGRSQPEGTTRVGLTTLVDTRVGQSRWDNPRDNQGNITWVKWTTLGSGTTWEANTQGGQSRGDNPGGTTQRGVNPRKKPEEGNSVIKIHCMNYCLISTIALENIPPKGVDVNQECQCGKMLEGNPNEGLLSIANLANKIVGGNPAEKVECT